ncbi:MAG: hypothetical protein QM755_07965, partial [Luteolibacter sp.]
MAGFEWGSVVAAIYAQNLSANEVEWELSKLKEFNKSDSFLKAVFEKKSTGELKVAVCVPIFEYQSPSLFVEPRSASTVPLII